MPEVQLERIVIVGAGQAGAQAVATLRAEGFEGSLTLLGDEPFPPYQRPPLSKAYLSGAMERERLFLKPHAFYTESNCELILDAAAVAIDRRAKTVTLRDGRTLSYDKLLLTTGSRVRQPQIPGAGLQNVFYLRGIADVDAMRARLVEGSRLAIIGGGYIGLEVAAVACKLGLRVLVFEALDRVMARAVSPPVSEFYQRVHREAGVHILLDTPVEAIEGSERVEFIRANDRSYPADLALIGVGIVPNVELALEAGLECRDGIVVDQYCASAADATIFAAGDCTQHIGRDGRCVRLECVQNAIDQAKHAALAMLGRPLPYREIPWFWSDQYDLKLQIAGVPWPGDRLVRRGDPESRKFAMFHLRDGAISAVEAVNAAPEYLVGRRLIGQGTVIPPERLADTAIPMKNIS